MWRSGSRAGWQPTLALRAGRRAFCGEVEAVRAGNPHLLKNGRGGGGCFVEKWKPCGLATHTCLRAGGGRCFVEKWKLCGLATRTCVRAGGLWFVELKRWGGGGCCVEKWKPRGLATHTCKWKPCGLATRTCVRVGGWWFVELKRWGGGVVWRSGSSAGWQPALAQELEGGRCVEVEVVRAGNPHLHKSGEGGGVCGEVEAVRAGNPHCFGAGGVVFFCGA